MTSIVDHQRNKEKRAKELRKRSTFKTPDRRFEPSVLKPQHANFNFGRKSTFKTPASTGLYIQYYVYVLTGPFQAEELCVRVVYE